MGGQILAGLRQVRNGREEKTYLALFMNTPTATADVGREARAKG